MNKTLPKTTRANILIGCYILIFAYVINYLINSFLIDNHALGVLSIELLEGSINGLIVLFFIIATLTLYVTTVKKIGFKKYKTQVLAYFLSCFCIYIGLYLIYKNGNVTLLTPVFLTLYAGLQIAIKNATKTNYYIVSVVSLLLGLLAYLTTYYWFTALVILGLTHCFYSLFNKQKHTTF